jgi:hypothetical protein
MKNLDLSAKDYQEWAEFEQYETADDTVNLTNQIRTKGELDFC